MWWMKEKIFWVWIATKPGLGFPRPHATRIASHRRRAFVGFGQNKSCMHKCQRASASLHACPSRRLAGRPATASPLRRSIANANARLITSPWKLQTPHHLIWSAWHLRVRPNATRISIWDAVCGKRAVVSLAPQKGSVCWSSVVTELLYFPNSP
jgi:hypothetical protein